MGGKGSSYSAPPTDPRIGQAAMMQAQTGQELAQLGRDELVYQRARTDRMDPIYEQLMNQAIDEGGKNAERADAQWQQYQDVFQPIENQMASEAVNYDNPAEVARREGLAAATVGRQFDAANEQSAREMGRMGVSPTSSLGAQAMRDQANAEAMAKAGAINQERSNTKLLGMSLRENAAKFGRNQTSTGLAASASALQGGNSAAGILGQQQQAGLAPAQQAGSLMGAGASQIGSSANILQNQWNGQNQAAQFAASLDAQNQAGLGSLIGSLAGAGIMKYSSEKLKEDIRPADDEKALGELEQVAVKDWKYKQGVEDGGQHTGPIAEDMHEQMGDDVAPGGVALDMVSVSGKHHAAIRALSKHDRKLAKRIDRLEQRVAGLRDVPDPSVNTKRLAPSLRGDISPGIVGLGTVLQGA